MGTEGQSVDWARTPLRAPRALEANRAAERHRGIMACIKSSKNSNNHAGPHTYIPDAAAGAQLPAPSINPLAG